MNSLGKELLEKIEELGLTQKAFSVQIGKSNSEINELIKGKRKITIAWDILFSRTLHTPEKYRIYKQIDLDYQVAKQAIEEKNKKEENLNSNFLKVDGNNISHLENNGEINDTAIQEEGYIFIDQENTNDQVSRQENNSISDEIIDFDDEFLQDDSSQKDSKIMISEEKIQDFLDF